MWSSYFIFMRDAGKKLKANYNRKINVIWNLFESPVSDLSG